MDHSSPKPVKPTSPTKTTTAEPLKAATTPKSPQKQPEMTKAHQEPGSPTKLEPKTVAMPTEDFKTAAIKLPSIQELKPETPKIASIKLDLPAINHFKIKQEQPAIKSETIETLQVPAQSLKDPYCKPSLSCTTCRKLFEQSNISAIKNWPYATLNGDDYYEYICQQCSKTGTEQISRVSLGWLEVVTLTFLNLDSPHHIQDGVKYFHWKQNICEFIDQHWNRFWSKPKSTTWKNSVASCLSTGPRFISLSKSSVLDSTVGLWGLDIKVYLQEPRKFKHHTIPITKDGKLMEEKSVIVGTQPAKKKEATSTTTKRKKVLNLQLEFDPENSIEIYPDLDNPKSFPKLSTESTHTAPQCKISPNGLSVTNSSGYRMSKCTHGVWSGSWYFEVKFEKSGSLRIGWAQISGDLQAPCGYDQFSYSFRSSPGALFHQSREQRSNDAYKVGYRVGDVLGCVIVLPDSDGDLEVDEKLLARLWDTKQDSYLPFQTAPMIKLKGSRIEYYLNGEPLGVAFEEIYQGI